eukprot:2840697-Alexandrium_andersonii.AAC.1
MLERLLGLQSHPLVPGQIAYRSNVEKQRWLAAGQPRLDVERWRSSGDGLWSRVSLLTSLARVELRACGARP